MGADISYVVLHQKLDDKFGYFHKYENEIKEFLKTVPKYIDVDSEKFKIRFEDVEDGQGVKVSCYFQDKGSNPNHLVRGKPYLYNTYKYIFIFYLIEMPGCCAYLISTKTWISEEYQGLKIAQFLQKLKFEIAEDSGYPFLFATSVSDNLIQNHILIKYSWEKIDEVYNKRTTNKIYTWKKEIK